MTRTRTSAFLAACFFAGAAIAPAVLTPQAAAAAEATREAEVEAASTSRLIRGLVLPAKSTRALKPEMVATAAAPLRRIAKGGNLSFTAPEVIMWGTAAGYQKGKLTQKNSLKAALAKAGWGYKDVQQKETEQGQMTIFMAIHKKEGAVMGYWLTGEELLVLAWGKADRAGATEQKENTTEEGSAETAPAATEEGAAS